eukprot:SAG11_NODE_10416_length_833_cov_1.916894_1_plen_143_part_00
MPWLTISLLCGATLCVAMLAAARKASQLGLHYQEFCNPWTQMLDLDLLDDAAVSAGASQSACNACLQRCVDELCVGGQPYIDFMGFISTMRVLAAHDANERIEPGALPEALDRPKPPRPFFGVMGSIGLIAPPPLSLPMSRH